MKTVVEFYHCYESGLSCVKRVWKLWGMTVWSKDYGLGYHENIRRAFIDNGQHSEKADQVAVQDSPAPMEDPYQPLFNFLSRELGSTATETEMQEIINICVEIRGGN